MINLFNDTENMKSITTHSVENEINKPKLTDFVKGFKFRYRGKPKCWLVGDGEYTTIIERDFDLLEDEWYCGYVTTY